LIQNSDPSHVGTLPVSQRSPGGLRIATASFRHRPAANQWPCRRGAALPTELGRRKCNDSGGMRKGESQVIIQRGSRLVSGKLAIGRTAESRKLAPRHDPSCRIVVVRALEVQVRWNSLSGAVSMNRHQTEHHDSGNAYHVHR
jgi:hypothetical protein